MAPVQTELINIASGFMKQFQELLNNVNELGDGETLQTILTETRAASEAIRLFKLQLLQEHLVGNISTTLPPTFFNNHGQKSPSSTQSVGGR